VDQIELRKPDSQWSHFAIGLLTFDLKMDLHMELLFFGAQATLASADIVLEFRGRKFGVLSTLPCPLGGGGKIKTQMAGRLVVDDVAVFREVARAVVHEASFTVELYAVVAVELRGSDHGCMLSAEMCKTVGTARIPGVTFAKSIVLNGADGFGIEMAPLVLKDLPSPEPAGRALIELDARIFNPSSFVMHDLDVVSIDVFTDASWPKMERPPEESLGVRFVEVNTQPGFTLHRGHSDWFPVEGFLSVSDREHDIVKSADVFNHFLTSRPTPLIPAIVGMSQPLPQACHILPRHVTTLLPPAGMSQPFYSAAAKGVALRAFLPGMASNDTNIIKVAYIDLDIPIATATLLNPLNGGRLRQYLSIELRNPLDATLYVFGLEADVMYRGNQIGHIHLPQMDDRRAIMLPPSGAPCLADAPWT